MMPELNAERNNALDIAKGITIILMVIGHCYSTENAILNLIYGFHMPLFFMISGNIYGNKLRINPAYKFRVLNMGIRLIRPYMGWGIALALFLSALQSIPGNVSFSSKFIEYLIKIVTLQGISILWYLPCILLTELMFILIYKVCRKALIPISLALYLLALLVKIDNNFLTVLWRSFIGLGFFVVGYFVDTFIDRYKNQKPFRGAFPILIMISLIILYVYLVLSKKIEVSLVSLTFGNPFLYTASAIIGSFSLLTLSYILASRVKAKFLAIFIYFGKKTLFVLGAHMFIIEVFRLIDYKLFGNVLSKLGLLEGIVFGTIVCFILLLVSFMIEKIKDKIISHQKKEDIKCRRSV